MRVLVTAMSMSCVIIKKCKFTAIKEANIYLSLLMKVPLPTPFFLCYSAVAEVSRIAEASSFQWRLQTS